MARQVGWNAAELDAFYEKLNRKYDLKEQLAAAKTPEPATNWYGGNKDEEEYWKEMRKRNTALETQKLINEGQANVQGIRNVGDIAGHEAVNAGAMARQKLMGETERYKADQSLLGEKYKADKSAEVLSSSAKTDPRALLFKTWGESMDPTPERLATLEAGYNAIFGKPQNQAPEQKKEAPTDFNTFDKPDTAPMVRPTTPPAVAPVAALPATTKPVEIDYTGKSDDEMRGFQTDWIRKNPNATTAGDSPLIIRRNQLLEKKRKEEAVAANQYNQGLKEAQERLMDPVAQKRRRELMGY